MVINFFPEKQSPNLNFKVTRLQKLWVNSKCFLREVWHPPWFFDSLLNRNSKIVTWISLLPLSYLSVKQKIHVYNTRRNIIKQLFRPSLPRTFFILIEILMLACFDGKHSWAMLRWLKCINANLSTDSNYFFDFRRLYRSFKCWEIVSCDNDVYSKFKIKFSKTNWSL